MKKNTIYCIYFKGKRDFPSSVFQNLEKLSKEIERTNFKIVFGTVLEQLNEVDKSKFKELGIVAEDYSIVNPEYKEIIKFF